MKVRFCPECGNTDIVMVGAAHTGLFRCKKCGFSSAIFPEAKRDNIKVIQKELNQIEEIA